MSELYILSNGKTLPTVGLSERFRRILRERPHCSPVYKWDEMSMAELFSLCYQDTARYCTEAKSWYAFGGSRWIQDNGALMAHSRLKEFVRLMELYCAEIPDEDSAKGEYRKFISKLGNRSPRERILKDAEDVSPIPAALFDAKSYLINCKNGTYDLRDFSFRPHRWDDYLTMISTFDYVEDATCPRWLTFIEQVTCGVADVADFLQRAVGYSLLGESNQECMFILYGKTTRNGKSTLLAALHNLLGDYAQAAPVGIICKSKNERDYAAANPVLMKLKGARLVTMSESDESGRLDEQAIKQYTGGEVITARALYGNPVSFYPQFKLWLSCNTLPTIADRSLFSSERIKVVEFSRHFDGDEQDKSLKTQFQEQDAMAGIFNWALRGYRKYRQHGLDMAATLQRVVSDYAKDNDIAKQFFEARCERAEGAITKGSLIYEAYKRWCMDNGLTPRSAIRFYKDMDRFGMRRNYGGYQMFKNIALTTTFATFPTSDEIDFTKPDRKRIKLV